jgi:hypothetical protein
MSCGCARRRELIRQEGVAKMLQHEAARLVNAAAKLVPHKPPPQSSIAVMPSVKREERPPK